ncbi:MAG: EscU/YscU/HrcU family type III secretion system export apparatus switch protein [Syntrophomonadaceae bacterium]|jgi:flagellar biosynthesis protein
MGKRTENSEMAKAVALRYIPQKDQAPVVVAKGSGFIAEQIKEVARESGIPLKEDQELVKYLMSLDLYEEIPPHLYAIIAEILAFIYSMDREY